MGSDTVIAWTDATFNIAWGCEKISPGCKFCYADRLSTQYGQPGLWGPGSRRRTFGYDYWQKPILWNDKARKDRRIMFVFSSSMCDVFDDHPSIVTERERLFSVIRKTPWIHWQLLTKRPENFSGMLPPDWGDGYKNVWLGVSIENADYIHRVDILCKTPARIHFISYEPALGPLNGLDLSNIQWVIYGGESGPKFRSHDLAWPRDMLRKCRKAGVAFFYKQSPAFRTETGIELDGQIIREYPIQRNGLPQLAKK